MRLGGFVKFASVEAAKESRMSRPQKISAALVFGVACCSHLSALAQGPGSSQTRNAAARCNSPVRTVNLTYLHALPGQREQLRQYIRKNWFAIDAKAVRAGLMKSYALWESSSKEASEGWDFIVVDTWCDIRGYEGVSSKFDALSKSHKSIPIDGKHFEQLGRRGESKELIEHDRGE
jgi:hypothetical protein